MQASELFQNMGMLADSPKLSRNDTRCYKKSISMPNKCHIAVYILHKARMIVLSCFWRSYIQQNSLRPCYLMYRNPIAIPLYNQQAGFALRAARP